MTDTRVAVVGAGLAGLNVARLLHQAGVEVEVYEARDRIGGRVLTVDATGAATEDGFDLGPSWFWPHLQPGIGELVDELGVASFAQSTDGDVIFERMSREPAQRYPGQRQPHSTMRVAGGTASLINAVARTLPAEQIHLAARVTNLELHGGEVQLTVLGADGRRQVVRAEQVVAAVPPRLLEATVELTPQLPEKTVAQWRGTPTWMAPHAKLFAIYDEPFWLADGYSGTAQSMVGPMLEIHDATTRSGWAALFGFLGVGAVERRHLDEQALTEACVAQFARLFGERAGRPVATLYRDWAADPLTATPDDLVSSGHASAAPAWVHGPWSARLTLAGSETSPAEAGYLAGAVIASRAAAETMRQRLGDGASLR